MLEQVKVATESLDNMKNKLDLIKICEDVKHSKKIRTKSYGLMDKTCDPKAYRNAESMKRVSMKVDLLIVKQRCFTVNSISCRGKVLLLEFFDKRSTTAV